MHGAGGESRCPAPRGPFCSSLSPSRTSCSSTNCGRRWSCCGLSARTAASTCGDCHSTWVSTGMGTGTGTGTITGTGTVTGTMSAQRGADGLSLPLSSSRTDLPAPGGLAGPQAARCPAQAGAAGGLKGTGTGTGSGTGSGSGAAGSSINTALFRLQRPSQLIGRFARRSKRRFQSPQRSCRC